MARNKCRASNFLETYGWEATLTGRHTAENLVARTLSEGQSLDVASPISDCQLGNLGKAETTCGFCAVSCRLEMQGKDNSAIGIQPADDPDSAPMNSFLTCVKGKFGHNFVNGKNRLTGPLIRNEGDELGVAPWNEALDYITGWLRGIQDEHSVDAVGCLVLSKGSNKEAYLVWKFMQ